MAVIADWQRWVLEKVHPRQLKGAVRIQSLWGGYGELLRLQLEPGPNLVLKWVQPPIQAVESTSDRRKRRSYQVEQAWYRGPGRNCPPQSRIATCLGLADGWLLLEDLEAQGYRRSRGPGPQEIAGGLDWLAQFHAAYLGQAPAELWEQGSYWHLETRRDEWAAMQDGPFKQLAEALDQRLRAASFQTLLHGDAKPANFLWDESGRAAAVDFQYVGPGCGIRDVAYFLDGCLDESGCQLHASHWLDHYFAQLCRALGARELGQLVEPLEREWRQLYPVAWSDFFRFWQGWGGCPSPGSYTLEQLQQAQLALQAYQPGG